MSATSRTTRIAKALANQAMGPTGNVFYVDSGATAGLDASNAGTNKGNAFLTLDYAFSQCTANNGDIIYVLPGHAETTTAIGLDVAGVRVIGVGVGRSRPVFTSTAVATDLFSVSAESIQIENLRLVGAASACTALINVAAADFTCISCSLEQAATPVNGVTIAAGGHRFRFIDCQFLGTAAGPNNAILIESSTSHDWVVEDCIFNYAGSSGLDEAAIASSFKTTGGIVRNCDFIAMDLTACDFNSSTSAQGDGLISNCNIVTGANVANIDTVVDAGGYSCCNVRVADNPTTSGGLIPVLTPA